MLEVLDGQTLSFLKALLKKLADVENDKLYELLKENKKGGLSSNDGFNSTEFENKEWFLEDLIKVYISNAELKSIVKVLPEKRRDELFHVLKEDVTKRYWERKYWNIDVIMKDLEKNHIKWSDCEIWWYEWRIISLDLPPVWDKFKWFKFQCFRSYGMISKNDFEKNKNIMDMSYTMEELSDLFRAMNKYMKANWIYTDEYMDYEHELWEHSNKEECRAWGYIRYLLWLTNDWIWLKNTKKRRGSVERVLWNVHCGNCAFYSSWYNWREYMLLKLPS